MNLFKKTTNRILIITSGFLILVIGILFFLYWNNQKKDLGCGTKTTESVCGNNSSNLSEKVQKGKAIFNSNCAACHKLYLNMTGPALSKIDSTKLWNWMTEKDEKADSTKLSEMKIDYHKKMWSKNFDDEQLTELYEYTKN